MLDGWRSEAFDEKLQASFWRCAQPRLPLVSHSVSASPDDDALASSERRRAFCRKKFPR